MRVGSVHEQVPILICAATIGGAYGWAVIQETANGSRASKTRESDRYGEGVEVAPTVRNRFGSLVILGLAFLVMAAPAVGASCAEPVPLDQALAEAETVFVGTVNELKHDGRLAGFVVEEVWKGEVPATALVSGGPTLSELEGTGLGGTIVTSVDRPFEQGVTYLVVPFGVDQGVYMDNACSVTQAYDSSLDQYRPDSAHTPVEVGTDGAVLTARVALGVLAVMTAAGLVIARWRRGHAWSGGAG